MTGSGDKTNILLGVTGSIAAFKALDLVRRFKKRGLNVRVIMTESACQFIQPLTFESLTGNKVVRSMWDEDDFEGIDHIELGDWADVFVIAPATADTIAKLASGQAGNELLAAALVSRAPLLIAPAMNTNMYEHPATQENLVKLKQRGAEIIDPESGDLACGWNGTGRLADPKQIFYRVLRALNSQTLAGKKVVVSAGPTREMIDPVRFISNCSSGKMGASIAMEAFLRGADVEVVHGPVKIKVPGGVKKTVVSSAEEMQKALMDTIFNSERPADIVVMAAAVADVKPREASRNKIKKNGEWKHIDLSPNGDILQSIGEKRGDSTVPFLVGFAVETGEAEDLIISVKEKIIQKKVDVMVGNLAHDAFDKSTNHVWIVDKIGREDEVMTTYKSRIAKKIFDFIRKQS